MERELIVNAGRDGVEIALTEDRSLIEYHIEKEDSKFKVGDILLGKVRKINPGLNAAFVDVGHEKDAFLHYTDLGPQFRSLFKYVQQSIRGGQKQSMLAGFKMEADIIKTGKINNVMARGQTLMVQVLKEPISTKGPRISCEIALPGRYLVFTPFNPTIGISRRIESAQERSRLQRLLESIVPKNFGVIARTACENKSVQTLHEDLQELIDAWQGIHSKMKGAKTPKILFSESTKLNTLIRDILNPDFRRIAVDDQVLLHEIKTYIRKIAPDKEKIVQHYQSDRPIFDAFGITKQVKSLFGRTVSVRSGAYLIIEHTEALHVIDVNSGPKIARSGDQEQNAFKVNLETAVEVARQLRLRDLGGIIIIDFIDMRNPDNKKQIYKAVRDSMKEDRARHTVLPISKFGLMQITRQRVRPEVNMETTEVCPSCRGTGKIEASILITDEIDRVLEEVISTFPDKKIRLHAHPFIEAYLKKGYFKSQRFKWVRQYRKWISIVQNAGYGYTEFKFTDEHNEEFDLKGLASAASVLAKKTTEDKPEEKPKKSSKAPKKSYAKSRPRPRPKPRSDSKPKPKSDTKPRTAAKPRSDSKPKSDSSSQIKQN